MDKEQKGYIKLDKMAEIYRIYKVGDITLYMQHIIKSIYYIYIHIYLYIFINMNI